MANDGESREAAEGDASGQKKPGSPGVKASGVPFTASGWQVLSPLRPMTS